MLEKNKKFDAVEMSLNIKRKLYEENKNLSLSEYMKKLSDDAKNSKLWKGNTPINSQHKKI